MLFLFARMLLLPVTVTTRIIPFLSFGIPLLDFTSSRYLGGGVSSPFLTYAIWVKAKTEEGGWRDLEGGCKKKNTKTTSRDLNQKRKSSKESTNDVN